MVTDFEREHLLVLYRFDSGFVTPSRVSVLVGGSEQFVDDSVGSLFEVLYLQYVGVVAFGVHSYRDHSREVRFLLLADGGIHERHYVHSPNPAFQFQQVAISEVFALEVSTGQVNRFLLVLALEEVRSDLAAYLFQFLHGESRRPEGSSRFVYGGNLHHLPVFQSEYLSYEVVFLPSLHYEAYSCLVVVPSRVEGRVVPFVYLLTYSVGLRVFSRSVGIVDN